MSVRERADMQIYLRTNRLVLRQFIEADVDNLVALNGDPEVMRYVGTPTSRDEIEQDYLPAYLDYHRRGDRYGFWAAIEPSTGAFLGWFHFRPAEGASPDEPELGYRLHRAAWGQGYATEGSRALIAKGFRELGVRRVVASAFADNLASRRVLEKAGLRLVRTYRHTSPELREGEAIEYALDKPDWEQQEARAGRHGNPAHDPLPDHTGPPLAARGPCSQASVSPVMSWRSKDKPS
jgi:RimJ/RimL family protein N-acetyltransferase